MASPFCTQSIFDEHEPIAPWSTLPAHVQYPRDSTGVKVSATGASRVGVPHVTAQWNAIQEIGSAPLGQEPWASSSAQLWKSDHGFGTQPAAWFSLLTLPALQPVHPRARRSVKRVVPATSFGECWSAPG